MAETVKAPKHKTKRKTVVLGTATVTLVAGQSKNIKITLNRAGKRLLSAHHMLKVTMKITNRTAAGSKLVTSRTITFTVARPEAWALSSSHRGSCITDDIQAALLAPSYDLAIAGSRTAGDQLVSSRRSDPNWPEL